ncbi:uncharacterized protein (DUF924 family) [Sulfurirhabdus autotrophica]|uniref:Uncharacterized protein (DUF924 family) n=2 Tax=Sulfurirhabdus autotrophica TaxID=1706046 RepID=A0A4R3XUG4_9PROT|nr:uncharacterized protein (DUF924 family) [Sulfurirhabdus autotrophica]
MNMQAKEVLTFWFGTSDFTDRLARRKDWFIKNPEFDKAIRSKFLDIYKTAAQGAFSDWRQTPLDCLALIILLDQFPRNLFRGDAKSFSTDNAALTAAQHGVTQGFDLLLPHVARTFMYLPFEHSEQLEDQQRSIELFNQMQNDPEMTETIRYAQRHFDIIARFGRFPHRNKLLGRLSTDKEEAFLKTPGSSF